MSTGLKEDYTKKMAEKLNVYLSNIQITYMNVRGFHWNITGKQFFALHKKFEEIYNSLNGMADEIAEHSFSEYIKVSTVKERLNVCSADDTVKAILEDAVLLLKFERDILSLASDNDDEGTAALMSGFIGEQEKMIWMFNAFLK